MRSRPEGEAIRLFLVDDHEVVLEGLTSFFAAQTDMKIVGSARSAEEALAQVGDASLDIALVDYRLPDCDGIWLCREIRARDNDINCVMLSAFADDTALIEAALAGAAGYVLKDAPLGEVADAIRRVARGESLIDPEISRRAFAQLVERPRGMTPDLTGREEEVLALIAEGATNREIAQRLFLAEQTVKNYVSTILSKLGLRRRTQAALWATESARSHSHASGR